MCHWTTTFVSIYMHRVQGIQISGWTKKYHIDVLSCVVWGDYLPVATPYYRFMRYVQIITFEYKVKIICLVIIVKCVLLQTYFFVMWQWLSVGHLVLLPLSEWMVVEYRFSVEYTFCTRNIVWRTYKHKIQQTLFCICSLDLNAWNTEYGADLKFVKRFTGPKISG